MKAVKVRNPASLDSLDVVEMDEPRDPAAGEIKVKLHASSLNFHDYAVVAGMIPTDDGRIPLSDGAGEVIAVGDGVEDFAVGDRVISTFFPHWVDGDSPLGSFEGTPGDGIDGFAREMVTKPTSAFTHAPESLDFVEAATLPCAGVTAWRALMEDGKMQPGQTVLIEGTGGVSLFALLFAKAAGAKVIATSSSDEKLETVRKLGADHTINYKSNEKWGEEAYDWSGGGVDHVVEVGGPGTLNQAISAIRAGGHIHLIGILTGMSGEVQTAALMRKMGRLQGLTVGSHAMQRRMIAAIDANGLKPQISDRFALGNLADAFRHEEDGGHLGKIAIEI
ncbi:zinc-dependent alcohol dehydrogenase family protein [Alteriqipengyuania lutimaris]|uniref:NAD(P)-dependent alcohol dehydrogenase n=1 Tax=Alteriqipengyuania lutimaris TaxID=1538146 RepID=A0A395LKP4_9SPHN|nr:NAD(P)-dependent alcohol dehydrogenase [Alteriqipengyuania lutimaris]MBB3034111.1 NADPH:quinone reductase-like Zn-dependent oxidoreductase [Alteriqipengyuania lutimaris]RDS76957.1 NAD(P)-dependent alcohol dehydrogenase [Alteriqipengyuania lutimaris]